MTSLAVPPLRPVAIEKLCVNSRFHFALRLVGVALRVARVVRAIGIHARNERDRLAVGRPKLIVGASGKGSDPRRFPARQRNPIDLCIAVPPRKKRKLLAIRRPARPLIAPSARNLPRLAARCGDNPNIGNRVIRLLIGYGDGVGDPFSVGRDLWIAHAPHRNQIVECDCALRRLCQCSSAQQ